MMVFVAVSVFIENILYFVPPVLREDMTEYMLLGKLLLLSYVLSSIMVPHKLSLSGINILESPHKFSFPGTGLDITSHRGEI